MKCLLMVMICVLATLINSDVGDGAGDTLTWNVGDETPSSYNEFLSSLRVKVLKGTGEIYHGVPMIPKKVTTNFLLVVLQSSESGKTITLTLEENGLYLMGYSDKLEDTCRYHVFRTKDGKASVCDDKSADKRCRLCEGETKVEKKEIPYTFDYGTLEKKAGLGAKGRKGVELIFSKLNSFIKNSDKMNEKTEATFLLVAIQMVCEAARFSYIQEKVASIEQNFKADDLTICLEKNWDKASKKIKDTKGDTFDPPFKCDNFEWKAEKVSKLTSCMAILCNQDKTLASNSLGSLQFSPVLTTLLGIDNYY